MISWTMCNSIDIVFKAKASASQSISGPKHWLPHTMNQKWVWGQPLTLAPLFEGLLWLNWPVTASWLRFYSLLCLSRVCSMQAANNRWQVVFFLFKYHIPHNNCTAQLFINEFINEIPRDQHIPHVTTKEHTSLLGTNDKTLWWKYFDCIPLSHMYITCYTLCYTQCCC